MDRKKQWAVVVLVTAAVLTVCHPAFRYVLWRWESNPVLRGRLLAEQQGCTACHEPYKAVEIPNPGSRWGTVPRFHAGNRMMYVETREEIEEFVRFGAPRSWLDDPKVVARLEDQRLRMPAYGETLSADEISDLVAYACAVEGIDPVGGEAAALGRELAKEKGCLSCHGVEGSGGFPNPGSLGGFVPGFVGRNFSDLVRDEEEFREWIREGTSSRLAGNPIVAFFWRRQKLAMPAYGEEALTDEQIGDLWQWVQALRQTSD